MDKPEEQKKCFCAKCFMLINPEDKVDIDGQNFHRFCCMCCVCQTIPKSLRTFYGHVFCPECFKNHVLSRFRPGADNEAFHSYGCFQWNGHGPHSSCGHSHFMQSGEGSHGHGHACPHKHESEEKKSEPAKPAESSDTKTEGANQKRSVCSRCLQMIMKGKEVLIGGQNFHPECAVCCHCRKVPKDSAKIYYGQMFCEECFHRMVLGRDKDNAQEFYKNAFEAWNNNPHFAEHMKKFMESQGNNANPMIFINGQQQGPSFCRCGREHCCRAKFTTPSTSPPSPAQDEPNKCKPECMYL